MAKPFRSLRDKMSPAAQAAAEQKTQALLEALPLQELRQARQLSQEQLATILQVKQASISKLERRTDMYISTLRQFIEAMGGELEIVAKFPDGVVRITQFQEIAPSNTHSQPEIYLCGLARVITGEAFTTYHARLASSMISPASY